MSTQKVGRDTLRKLRRRYLETWGREWPEDDAYLAELWLEARGTLQAKKGPKVDAAYADALVAMRESHEFPTQSLM